MKKRVSEVLLIFSFMLSCGEKDLPTPVISLSDFQLVFNQPTLSSCQNFATLRMDDFIVENNVWSASSLPSGSFSQCVYLYQKDEKKLLGWKWEFPSNPDSWIYAYPQLIFGWKPWYPGSTTQKLPRSLSSIKSLKVDYETEGERNEGRYNLAFDIWITESAAVSPDKIRQEVMIWEETNGFVPGGNFVELVTTESGVYKLYVDELENWSYLALQRTETRTKGTVNIYQIIDYLIQKGYIAKESYLASVEFGNEVGNSKGSTLVKKFEILLE